MNQDAMRVPMQQGSAGVPRPQAQEEQQPQAQQSAPLPCAATSGRAPLAGSSTHKMQAGC